MQCFHHFCLTREWATITLWLKKQRLGNKEKESVNQLKRETARVLEESPKILCKDVYRNLNKEKNEESSWSVGDIFVTFCAPQTLRDVMIALFVCLFCLVCDWDWRASFSKCQQFQRQKKLVQQVRATSAVFQNWPIPLRAWLQKWCYFIRHASRRRDAISR